MGTTNVVLSRRLYSVSWQRSDGSGSSHSPEASKIRKPMDKKVAKSIPSEESGEYWEEAHISGMPSKEETKIGGPQHIFKKNEPEKVSA